MKKKKTSTDELQSVCRAMLRDSLGGPGTEISILRERNMEYYNATPTGDLAPPDILNRSRFVATDVADTIEGMLPQLMKIFIAGENAVEFEARNPQTEDQAKMATAYINYLFYVRNDGVGIVYDWFKDALLLKNSFVKVWCEEDSEDSKQTFEGVTPEQLIMLQQEGWQLDGQPEQDEQGLINFTVVKNEKKKCIKVQVCPPHEMRIDSNARYGDEPAGIAHVFYKRRFELEEEGYDLSNIGHGSMRQASDNERLALLGEMTDDTSADIHDSHALFECQEVYIKLDADGDGVAEWLKCFMIEETLQDKDVEQVDSHPFVWISPIPRPHAFFGDCPADFAIGPQKLSTDTIRAIDDNLMLTVNQRTYVNREANVNVNAILDNVPGGVVDGDGPMERAINPIVQPSLSGPAYQFKEWIDTWRENRTGFTKYSQGTDSNALNKTATGVSIITQKSDLRMELIARFFAVGMQKLFGRMLKLAVQHQKAAEMVKINGEWAQINPSEWRDQFGCSIKVGLGTGSKEQLAARVMGLADMQMKAQPMGLVEPQHFAETLRLYVEANEFKNPDRFFTDKPSGVPSTPDQFNQFKQAMDQQTQAMQAQLQEKDQENTALKRQLEDKDRELGIKEKEVSIKAMDSFHRNNPSAAEPAPMPPELAAITDFVAQQTQALSGMVEAIAVMQSRAHLPRNKTISIALPSGGTAFAEINESQEEEPYQAGDVE